MIKRFQRLTIIRRVFSDNTAVIKAREERQMKREEKERRLSIKVPVTEFNPRSIVKKEEALISVNLHKRLMELYENRDEKVKYIVDSSNYITDHKINVNQITAKIFSDFEQKYRLLKGDNYQMITGINVFNDEFNELSVEHAQEQISEYVNSLIRWGIGVRPNNVFTSLSHSYINCVYDVFAKLIEKDLLYERQSKLYWSCKEDREVNKSEFRLEDKKCQIKLAYLKVKGFGNSEITEKQFENDELYFLVTVKNLFELVFGSGLLIHPGKNYVIVKHNKRYVVVSETFYQTNELFKEGKKQFIDKKTGEELMGWTVENLAYPEQELELLPLPFESPVEEVKELNKFTGVKTFCPQLYVSDFDKLIIFGMEFEDLIDNKGALLGGKYKGKVYKYLEEHIERDFKHVFTPDLIETEKYREMIKTSSEERVILKSIKELHLSIPEEIKQKLVDFLNNTKTFGPSKGFNERSLAEYILLLDDIKLSSSKSFGIPVPILQYKGSRSKYIKSKTLSEKYKQFVTNSSIDEWNSFNIKEVLPDSLKAKVSLLKTDKRVFSGEFLKSLNYYYLKKYFQFNNKGNLLEAFESGKLKEQEMIENNDLYFDLLVSGVQENRKELPIVLIIQMLLTNEMPVKEIKFVSNLLNNDMEFNKEPANTVVEGVVKKEGVSAYGAGTDSFRLFTASTDIKNNTFTDIVLSSTFLSSKLAEINLIRKIYWEMLKYIGLDYRIKEGYTRQSLGMLEQMVLNELDIAVRLMENGYKEKDYNLIYTVYLDFMKYLVLDFYLPSRKEAVILSDDELLASQTRFTLCTILQSTLIAIAPIIPLNAENIYNSIKFKEKAGKMIFEEKWPQSPLLFNRNSKLLTIKLNCLKTIKEKIISLQQKEKQEIDFMKYSIELVLDKSIDNDNYEAVKKDFDFVFGDMIKDLPLIFNCEQVKLHPNHHHKEIHSDFSITTKIKVEGFKLPIKIYLVRLDTDKQCKRCNRYRMSEHNDEFCFACYTNIKNKTI